MKAHGLCRKHLIIKGQSEESAQRMRAEIDSAFAHINSQIYDARRSGRNGAK